MVTRSSTWLGSRARVALVCVSVVAACLLYVVVAGAALIAVIALIGCLVAVVIMSVSVRVMAVIMLFLAVVGDRSNGSCSEDEGNGGI